MMLEVERPAGRKSDLIECPYLNFRETLLQANQMAKEARRRRVKAAVMRHWTPVEVAAWIGRLLQKAEVNNALYMSTSSIVCTAGTVVNNRPRC